MTVLRVDPGVCAFEALVRVDKRAARILSVSVESACGMVQELGKALGEIGLFEALAPIAKNRVHQSAATCLKHSACPVPAGILKAIEVEAGMALPREVRMVFVEEQGADREDES